jgi:hypothetical protein
MDREHTVIAVDGGAVRVICGFCQSQHNYRGGPRVEAAAPPRPAPSAASRSSPAPASSPARTSMPLRARPSAGDREVFPLVTDRERRSPPVMIQGESVDLELLLRRIVREEAGLTAVAPAEKWRGGDLVLRPGKPGVQEKSWPIETFFHKVVMLRNRLRTLEQQLNASELPEDQKVRLQGYISGCYGSLTSFNVLFADEDDQFKGGGGD